MPVYNPPLRDMQFVLHELLDVNTALRAMPKHAEVDVDTINAVLEEGGKFAAEVVFPLNISGDQQGCQLNRDTHEVRTPEGFAQAYARYVEGGWPSLACDTAWLGPARAARVLERPGQWLVVAGDCQQLQIAWTAAH